MIFIVVVVVLKQAKEAKRSKITKKSLQEFLADSEPQEENRKGSEDGSKVKKDCEEEIPRARTTATEENETEIQQENHPEAAEGSEVRDCGDDTAGTGNEEKEEQQKGNSGMSEAGDGCGPLQPSDKDQPRAGDVESLAEGLAAIKVADGCQNSTSCEQKSCQLLDGSKETDVEGVSDSVALFSGEPVKNATESGIEQVGASQHLDSQPEEPSQGASKEASSAVPLLGENTTAQSFQVDSLQACLKKFCSPELLTGNNKFACTFCTKEKEFGTNEAQHHMSTSSEVQTTTEDMLEVSTEDKEEEKNLPQQPENHGLVAASNSTSEQESEKAGSSACEHAQEAASEVSDNQFEKSNEERTDAGGSGVLSSEGSCQESGHDESGKESDGKNFVLYYTTMHAYACYSFLHQMKMMCPRRRGNDIKRKRANWFSLKPQSSC